MMMITIESNSEEKIGEMMTEKNKTTEEMENILIEDITEMKEEP